MHIYLDNYRIKSLLAILRNQIAVINVHNSAEYTLAHRPGEFMIVYAIESAAAADHYSGVGLNSPEL